MVAVTEAKARRRESTVLIVGSGIEGVRGRTDGNSTAADDRGQCLLASSWRSWREEVLTILNSQRAFYFEGKRAAIGQTDVVSCRRFARKNRCS